MLRDIDSVVAIVGIAVGVAVLLISSFIVLRSRGGSAKEFSRTEIHRFRLRDSATSSTIGFITGDMMRVRSVDIWVNPENTGMQMAQETENSISGLIRYWGASRYPGRVIDHVADELTIAVGEERPVAAGTVFVTGPGELAKRNNVKRLIHVAAVEGGGPGEGFLQVADIGQCLTNVLSAAEGLATAMPPATTILFPLLGVGNGRGDVATTIDVMLDAAVKHLESNTGTQLTEIFFLGYTVREANLLRRAMSSDPRLVEADQERA